MREQPWVGLGDNALFHPAREERRPRELDVPHARAGGPPCFFLPRRLALDRDDALLGDEHAVSQDVVIAQIEQPVEQSLERGSEVTVIRSQLVESVPLGLERLGMDFEQAVKLRLEVVIQRG